MIYGWSYGVWFAFFLFKYVRPRVQTHVRKLLETNHQDITIHDQAAVRGQSLKYIFIALVAWIILIVASGLIYFFTSHHFDYPDFWIRAIIACKQGKEDSLSPNKMFSNIAFIDTAGASNIFGAYFGIILDAMYLKGTPSTINHTPLWKTLLRGLLSALLIAPLMLTYLLISDDAPMMLVYLFKRTVPFFTVMLSLFSFVKLAHLKLKLVSDSHLSS